MNRATPLLLSALLLLGVGCDTGSRDDTGKASFGPGSTGAPGGGAGGGGGGTGSGSFAATADMNNARAQHTISLLNDGRVLVVGGLEITQQGIVFRAESEIFDPSNSMWTPVENLSPTPADGFMNVNGMPTVRARHTATLIPDGRVVIIGGLGVDVFSGPGAGTPQAMATCFFFDPNSHTFTQTGSLNGPRQSHGATLLSNGSILAAGGIDNSPGMGGGQVGASVNSAEVFAPGSGTWNTVASMASPHTQGNLVTVGSQVLYIGGAAVVQNVTQQGQFVEQVNGFAGPTVESFDLSGNTWIAGTAPGSDRVLGGVSIITANSTLMLAGGANTIGPTSPGTSVNPFTGQPAMPAMTGTPPQAVIDIEVFSTVPAPGAWTVSNTFLMTPRKGPQVAEIRTSGDMVIIGGADDSDVAIGDAEVWSVLNNTLIGQIPMVSARRDHKAVRFADGIIVTGGFDDQGATLTSCEIHTR